MTLTSANLLQQEFCQRRAKNPRYSLRAFAKSMGIPSGRVSEILSGKRSLTPEMANKISERLGLGIEVRTRLFASIALERQLPIPTQTPTHELNADEFNLIADWYHFAILSLMETKGFQSDIAWMAKRLGISSIETRSAMDRLKRLGCVEEKNGKYALRKGGTTTTHEVPSSALRKSHKQSLEQSIQALEEIPVELRDITSMTMAIDVVKIPAAKAAIKEFRRKISALLESGKQTEVYNINIQLVPVTKIQEKV